ncbi:MAG: redox-sensing transcriptional repressor Rex [Bacteroidota bacterium]|jgi:redox-sensing transcriptional repressor|nr:redox-sensing transcriptional repressor Rex [Ignavibacteria bacterium]MCU7498221.1 redox-sensing transcriptional repressor Rex [Ignavibacteria bacterium]MCU7511287.1 redox-sensing transcriptional repressor Rex [Ignavibacteria bacterium]MCU7518991.1 redox-sensing transcriptional repressor Rex [Ignavibacteria bacterium]MCU7523272.1 redox-sensing transcriptional repressor Rex [Ignavibacteria bacterium]
MVGNKHSIIRLLKYKSSLLRFRILGFKRVFSDNLADAADVTAAQVRKDFSLFGIPGNRRGGYQIDELLSRLNSLLGKDVLQKVIIVGAGHIGSALMRYKGFDKEGIQITAGFDIDPEKIQREGSIPVYPFEELKDYVKNNNIKIGIISVTEMFAQHVLDTMVEAGIKGVLNFAPIKLKGPDDVFISNVDLLGELEKVIYFVKSAESRITS